MGSTISKEQANNLFAGIQNHKTTATTYQKATQVQHEAIRQHKACIYEQACALLIKRMNSSMALQVMQKC